MLASELIDLLQSKIDRFGDVEIYIKEYWTTTTINIDDVLHKWEDWILILINK